MSLILNDKELLSVDEDGTADYFCEGIRIDRVVCDFFTGEKNWQITLFDPTTGSHPVVVPRGLPARQLITKLRRAGLTCADDDDTIKAICDYLYDVSEPMAVREITHNRLGFQTINSNGEQVFLAHHPVCLSEPGKFVSTYYQPEKTMPKGSLKGWRKGMRSCILGRPNMELVLAMIALPQISHKLRENNLVNDVPIIAFIGPSSTGKTLSLRTLGSGYGRPVISSGIIDDLNCTMNSFYARMNGNYGWPILLDESTSKNNDWNFPSILYTLANGQDKARCDSSGAHILDGTAVYGNSNVYRLSATLYVRRVKHALFGRIRHIKFTAVIGKLHFGRARGIVCVRPYGNRQGIICRGACEFYIFKA